ncbi:A/G-specific adenine glycosylase [Candidatus Woesearchaeota archaeon]|nr:A/G-specific adenine glycosylase [Candidatus Woesearchaeota archaeon]
MELTKKRFERELLSWYSQQKRDLPWRKTDDPYKILVSEIMLQQTQVDRVIPKYLSFLKQFPTVQDLASSSPGDIIRIWSGLGYNRRAIKLLECAKAVVTSHDGKFPRTEEELQKLPGIGPYTSAAILAFAYNLPAIVIDTNIRRVFFRIFLGKPSLLPNLQQKIINHVSKENSREYHNALMDFGAMICTARSPKCEECIFSQNCTTTKIYSKEEMETIASTIFKTKQSKFIGSNRYYRSMILKKVQEKNEITIDELKRTLPQEKDAKNLVAQLVKDKLLIIEKKKVFLPK